MKKAGKSRKKQNSLLDEIIVWIQLHTIEPDNQAFRENDRPENQDEDRKRGQPEMMNGRFTAIEGVPGIRLQHISSMQDGTASLQTLRLWLLWETDVTGQGLRDVVHTVHLQIGLIWKKKQWRDIK